MSDEPRDPLELHKQGGWPDLDEQPDATDGGLDDEGLDELFDDPGEVVEEEDLQ